MRVEWVAKQPNANGGIAAISARRPRHAAQWLRQSAGDCAHTLPLTKQQARWRANEGEIAATSRADVLGNVYLLTRGFIYICESGVS